MAARPDFYRILHVQPDAPVEIIRTSYRTLMQALKMHPDLGGDHGQASLLNEAFATLKDPVRRAAYDRELEGVEPAPPPTRSSQNAPSGPRPEPPATAALPSGKRQCAFCSAPHTPHDAIDPLAVCWSCGSPICAVPKAGVPSRSGRALARVSKELAVQITVAGDPPRSFSAITEDISINGARIVSSVLVAAQQRLKLDCAICTAIGVVRHVQPDDGGRCRVGIEFVTLLIKQPRGAFVSTHA